MEQAIGEIPSADLRRSKMGDRDGDPGFEKPAVVAPVEGGTPARKTEKVLLL